MSLGRKTVRGVFWNYLSFAAGKLLTFVSTVVLARLLAPEHFGVVAIALLAINYLDVIGDLGIAAALIYQRDDIERASHVAFSISIVMGVVLWALATTGAPLVGAYFNEPAVVPMLRVLAFTFLIQAFGNVHVALLNKELEFRRSLLPDLVRSSAKGCAAIGLALAGWGAWSLVWGQVLGAIMATIALWVVQPWRPRFVWDAALGRRMLGYGLQIVLLQILSVVWDTADYVVVGKALGRTDLGLYQQAFRVSDLLILNICFVVGRVLFPSYTKLNHSPEAVRHGVLATMRYVALITLPISAGLCAVAPLFVNVVFGPRWLAMTPALQLLALRAGIGTLFFNVGYVLKAIGQPGIVNKLLVVKLAVMVPTLLFAVRFGFVGVAAGQVGVALFSALLDLGMIIRVVGIPARAIWRQMQSPLLAAAGMGIAVWSFVSYAAGGWQIQHFVLAICLGVAWYGAMLWLTERRLVVESLRLFVQMLRPERSMSG